MIYWGNRWKCEPLGSLSWRRQWHPTPVLLPGESQGWQSLVGCSPWGAKSRTRLSNFTFTFHFHALEKAMATHSSTLAWKIPWTEEPGRVQSMGSLESDTTEQLQFHFSLSCIGEGNGNPLQCSCLENPRDGGAWWAAVYGVAQSWPRLKRLSSSRKPFLVHLPHTACVSTGTCIH